eukprot:TRINITY_DN1091_c0_g1_i1.p1 TRINITY_DN1091_c0_g1~~TRINITY_DN1091_c0_g1_i1.p1  ORF type:complete len:682 (+),score=105.98 TRINITY_DN1091_c0_g1_i1:33-2078(+)
MAAKEEGKFSVPLQQALDFWFNFRSLMDGGELSEEEREQALDTAHSHVAMLMETNMNILCHAAVANSVDYLVANSSHGQLRALMQHMRGHFLKILSTTGLSRILENILTYLPADMDIPSADNSIPLIATLRQLVAEIECDVATLLDTLPGCMALRSIIAVVSGRPFHRTPDKAVARPVLFEELGLIAAQVLARDPSVVECATYQPSSLVIQELLAALPKVLREAKEIESSGTDRHSQWINQIEILYTRFRDAVIVAFGDLISDKFGAHVLDALVVNCLETDYARVVQDVVLPKVTDLIQTGKGGIFLLQNCLASARTTEHLQILDDALTPELLEHLVSAKEFGVLVAFLQTAQRIGSHQKACVKKCTQCFRKAFNMGKDANTIKLSAMLIEAPWRQTGKQRVTHYGHLVLQHLLTLGCPAAQLYFDGVVEYSSSEGKRFLEVARSKSGSRVLEAFFRHGLPQHIAKAGQTLVETAADLAKDENASYVLETAYSKGGLQLRRAIAEQLSARLQELLSYPGGLMIVKKCRIEQFRLHREEWEAHQTVAAKREHLMATIVGSLDAKMAETDSKPRTSERQPSNQQGQRKRNQASIEENHDGAGTETRARAPEASSKRDTNTEYVAVWAKKPPRQAVVATDEAVEQSEDQPAKRSKREPATVEESSTTVSDAPAKKKKNRAPHAG